MVMFNHNRYIKKFKEHIESMGLEFRFPLNEMFYTPKETLYNVEEITSTRFKDHYDYDIWFDTDKALIETGHTYVVQFIYYEDFIGEFKYKPLLNVSFTTKEQYFLSKDLNEDDAEKIYEMPTNKNEREELMQRLLYIFKEFHIKYGYVVSAYVVGETEDTIKINYYRNLIKDSLKNVKETIGISSINKDKPVYYFEVINSNSE
jgi:hypothetical protein